MTPLKFAEYLASKHDKKMVLLIEDELTYAILFQSYMKKFGCAVKVVSSCAEALALNLKDFKYAFVDYMLPSGMDGYECIHALRAQEPDLCCIIHTGYSTHPDLRRALEEGLTIVPKPITDADFVKAVMV